MCSYHDHFSLKLSLLIDFENEGGESLTLALKNREIESSWTEDTSRDVPVPLSNDSFHISAKLRTSVRAGRRQIYISSRQRPDAV